MSNAPKPERGIRAAKHVKTDFWTKRHSGGHTAERVPVPHGEPPICCPDSKQPTPQPVNDLSAPKGQRQCEKKTGGCGATWTPEEG